RRGRAVISGRNGAEWNGSRWNGAKWNGARWNGAKWNGAKWIGGGLMHSPRVLVAGIGNIFLGDDGFGCAVIERLARRPQPEGVRVRDFGILGLDLAYALLDGYDVTILIDAVSRGGK